DGRGDGEPVGAAGGYVWGAPPPRRPPPRRAGRVALPGRARGVRGRGAGRGALHRSPPPRHPAPPRGPPPPAPPPPPPPPSPPGVTALTTPDGRVTIFMPHPERVFRAVQNSWRPPTWREDGAWLRIFRNARVWVA